MEGNCFYKFKHKIKHIKQVLSKWSRENFRDIFQQIIFREEVLKLKEHLFLEDPSPENRSIIQKAQAELKQYLHYEEEFQRQKTGLTWFSEGDRITKFFHNLVKARRNRLKIKRIQGSDGNWLEEDLMGSEAVDFYQKRFHQEEENLDFSILEHIPNLITKEENEVLTNLPDEEEASYFQSLGKKCYWARWFIRNILSSLLGNSWTRCCGIGKSFL